MAEPVFFPKPDGLTLSEIIALTQAEPVDSSQVTPTSQRITGIASLDLAGPRDISFFDNPQYAQQFATTRAGVCLIGRRAAVPASTHAVLLRAANPYRAFVEVARTLYPSSLTLPSAFASEGVAPGAYVHPSARLEQGVTVDPGAVIGPHVEIGAGSLIGAGAVVGAQVRIGRNTRIGPQVTLSHSLIGNRVAIHAGCRIGQDGFGYVSDAKGHHKVPQLGRVIIQDGVEIGAGTTIDRGAARDTVIGEGTKIDNLVQIAHNVVIGRHCIIVGQCGISGSATLEDGVVLGGNVGVNNHVTIGAGAQIAATSAVHGDVPARARWGGVPAMPVKQWFREMLLLEKLAARETQASGGAPQEGKGE